MCANIVPISLALLLSGCAAAGTCELIALKIYDPTLEQRLLSELDAAPTDAAWPRLVTDYVALRDEVKACKGNPDDGR